jgi:hypothetical protein
MRCGDVSASVYSAGCTAFMGLLSDISVLLRPTRMAKQLIATFRRLRHALMRKISAGHIDPYLNPPGKGCNMLDWEDVHGDV